MKERNIDPQSTRTRAYWLLCQHMLAIFGIVEAGTVWTIRRAVDGLKESPRLWQDKRGMVLSKLTCYSPHWRRQMHLKQSRMRPRLWLMIKGLRPKDQQVFAEPIPPDKFAGTHSWIMGS
eukprot:6742660-Prorocentrum_lima.AAC.1